MNLTTSGGTAAGTVWRAVQCIMRIYIGATLKMFVIINKLCSNVSVSLTERLHSLIFLIIDT